MSRPELPKLFTSEAWASARPAPNDSPAVWAMYRMMQGMSERIDARLKRLVDIVGNELTFGAPDDGSAASPNTPTSELDNLEGAWATAVITDPAQLGNGATAPITFTHGLNVPVQAAPAVGGYNLPNVRWPIVMFSHGAKGANIGPAPLSANPTHSSIYHRLGDAVTADTIQMRVHTGLTVNVAVGLWVEIFFTRAVR